LHQFNEKAIPEIVFYHLCFINCSILFKNNLGIQFKICAGSCVVRDIGGQLLLKINMERGKDNSRHHYGLAPVPFLLSYLLNFLKLREPVRIQPLPGQTINL
jgi:hypothetical protein